MAIKGLYSLLQVAYIMAAMCVNAMAVMVSASLVLTKLSGDCLREEMSSALQGTGHRLSL